MRGGGCSKFFAVVIVLTAAIALIASLVNPNKAKDAVQAAAPTVMPKAAVVSLGLAPYVEKAKDLAEQLDTQAAPSDILKAFNEKCRQGDYQGAYDYYQANNETLRKSCWAMNNVGLMAMQLGYSEEALSLFLAIQYKTQGSQPESLINLLVAGHAMGFGPKELMDAVGMDADIFKGALSAKQYSQDIIDGMIRSLCYNIIYMRMEEPEVGTASARSGGSLDIGTLLSQADPGQTLMKELAAISATDQDVKELLAYFEALLTLRGEQAAS